MTIKPENFEEKLVWYTIVGTYGLYFIGAQFIWVPVLGIWLSVLVGKKIWNQTENTPDEERITIPAGVWVWIAAMLCMEVALVMAHLDLGLDSSKIVFTTINSWARYWALMAMFPLAGCLKIRPKLIYRAACILCIQSLVFTILCYLSYALKLPELKYGSPLIVFRGPASNYGIDLYDIGGDIGEVQQFRMKLFAIFANNLGIVGNVYFFLASQESNRKLRLLGMIGAAAMVIGSGSRLTIVALAAIPVLTWFLTNFTWPIQIAIGVLSAVMGIVAPIVMELMQSTWDKAVNGYRASSALIRKRLAEVAMNRWQEAPIWGHGFLAEKGPKYTEHMPIGSHSQWPDLLYVRGIVGFTAFLIAMSWSFVDLLFKAQKSAIAKTALGIYLVLLFSTYAADIEPAAFVYWPGLMIMGMGFKEKPVNVLNLIEKKYTMSN